jgi:hypothetical protein
VVSKCRYLVRVHRERFRSLRVASSRPSTPFPPFPQPRSLLGTRDSEVCLILEDTELRPGRMGGTSVLEVQVNEILAP